MATAVPEDNQKPDRAVFELEGIRFNASERTLLDGIDLSFDAGCVYGLIGHNGSGKSTLMRLLARQQAPSAGRIAYRGMPVGQWTHRAFAREVAYLGQHLPAATGLTVRELAELGRYPWHGALGRFDEGDHACVDAALEQTGVVSFADRLVDTLSGGERQRAWLAMLVAQEGRCLLLDEPISALDVAHQVEVMELVRSLSHQRQLTVVVVLHDINIAARYCDRLVALHGGRQLADGSPEEIVRPEMLARIYGVTMGVIQHPEHATPIGYVA